MLSIKVEVYCTFCYKLCGNAIQKSLYFSFENPDDILKRRETRESEELYRFFTFLYSNISLAVYHWRWILGMLVDILDCIYYRCYVYITMDISYSHHIFLFCVVLWSIIAIKYNRRNDVVEKFSTKKSNYTRYVSYIVCLICIWAPFVCLISGRHVFYGAL